MPIEAHRAGPATIGLPGRTGLPVAYEIVLEHDGASLLAFAGAVRAASSASLKPLQGHNLVLCIEHGPDLDVTICEFQGECALLELAN
jgi:hypothetical protein